MYRKVILTVCLLAFSLITTGCMNDDDVKSAEEEDSAAVRNESNWVVSQLFKSNNYMMIGEEGRIGFIYDDSEVTRFYPDKVNKYMWHFWGNHDELEGTVKITATHEKKKEEIVLFEDLSTSGPNNGADRHAPSYFSLPESGIWRLDAFFGDEFFGSVFVKVYEK